MPRQWNVRRTVQSDSEAARRWDRAYQKLLAWTSQVSTEPRTAPVVPRKSPAREVNHESALYARVSTHRQAQAQTVEQQLDHLRNYAQQQGWTISGDHVFRDDGYSGASLKRPGLDRLRDRAADCSLDLVLLTAPDRLARNYVHQVLLLEELDQYDGIDNLTPKKDRV